MSRKHGAKGKGKKNPALARFVPTALEHVSPRAGDAVNDPFAEPTSPEEMQLLGERLYPLVCARVREEPEVVTGMLLELPRDEIEGLIKSGDALDERVDECVQALRDRGAALSPHQQQMRELDPEPILHEIQILINAWGKAATLLQGINTKMGNVHLYMYGSCLLGVATPDSDVDILVAVPKHICRVRDFFGLPVRGAAEAAQANEESLMGILRADARVSDLMAVPDAFVPCIKLRFDGIAVDLTFANLGLAKLPKQPETREGWAGDISCIESSQMVEIASDAPSLRSLSAVRATHALLTLVPDVEIFRQTLRLVKSWAKLRGIYGNAVGFLGGMSWAVLTAKVCQDFPSHSTEHTLALFFRVYVSWQWPRPVRLQPLKGRSKAPQTFPDLDALAWDPVSNLLDSRHLMPILTPAYPCMNSTFNTGPSTFRVLKSEFERGALIANAGAVMAVPPLMEMLLRSSRAYFFTRYARYVRLNVVAPDPERHRRWVGLVSALLRHLVRMLETTKQCFVHPWPHSEIVMEGDGFRDDVCICSYFIGVVDLGGTASSGGTAAILDAVAEFRRLLVMRSAGWYDKSMTVTEQILPRGSMPESIVGSPSPKSPGGGPFDDPVPPRNVDASDFCSCVDEQQMQAWETAIIARSAGIDSGHISARMSTMSEAERSAAIEVQTAHDSLAATCEGLTRELAIATGQASREKQGLVEQRRDRDTALKQAEAEWNGQKKELEADLDNARAALNQADARASAAVKRAQTLERQLASLSKQQHKRDSHSPDARPSPSSKQREGAATVGVNASPNSKKKSKAKNGSDKASGDKTDKADKTEQPPRADSRTDAGSSARKRNSAHKGAVDTSVSNPSVRPKSSTHDNASDQHHTQSKRNSVTETSRHSNIDSTLMGPAATHVSRVITGLESNGVWIAVACIIVLVIVALGAWHVQLEPTPIDTTSSGESGSQSNRFPARSCTANTCLNGGSCVDPEPKENEATCDCAKGFGGSLCEEQIVDTAATTWWDSAAASVSSSYESKLCPSPCHNGGECVRSTVAEEVNGAPPGQCACKEGFAGTSCENAVEECDSMPCAHGATCVDAVGRYVCICTADWRGPECQYPNQRHAYVAACDCENGGVCINGGSACQCPEGTHGDLCELLHDNCASSPCANGAACHTQLWSFSCHCGTGFEGDTCEVADDDCASKPCKMGEVCQSTAGGYTCGNPLKAMPRAVDKSFEWVGSQLTHSHDWVETEQLIGETNPGNEPVPEPASEACADARALHTRGRFAAAATKYVEAIQAGHPDLALMHSERAMSLASDGDHEGAYRDNNLAIALDPTVQTFWSNLANWLAEDDLACASGDLDACTRATRATSVLSSRTTVYY